MEFLPGFERSPIAGSLACRRPLKSGLCLAMLPALEFSSTSPWAEHCHIMATVLPVLAKHFNDVFHVEKQSKNKIQSDLRI
jgi:hypothetical protein